jgi:hypothetical protein
VGIVGAKASGSLCPSPKQQKKMRQLIPQSIGFVAAVCFTFPNESFAQCNGNKVVVNINSDYLPSETTWQIRSSGGTLLASGGPTAMFSFHTDTVCLGATPGPACYSFTLFDSFGDGMHGMGNWELRTVDGKSIIKDLFKSGTSSPKAPQASPGYGSSHNFCLPLGPADVLATECDIFNNALGNKVYCAKVPGATQYQFEFSDPDEGFIRRATVSRNYVIFSELVSNPLVPGVKYYARVRTNVAGPLSSAYWGSGCEMGLGIPETVLCPQLIEAPAYGHSCNELRAFNPSSNNSFIYATPVLGATEYQFRIFNASEGYDQTFIRSTYILQLKWNNGEAPPLVNGSTYSVQVNVKVNTLYSGFCGNTCNITIDNSIARQERLENGTTTLWPNPARDGQVNLNIGDLQHADQQISVDVQDMYGKQVFAQNFGNHGERFNTLLQLPGDLASGIYLVNITINGKRTVQRLSLIK